MCMSIIIKTPEEIVNIREAGKRLAGVVAAVAGRVAPGVTTQELDDYARELIGQLPHDGVGDSDTPAFLNYQPEGADYPFPAAACISVNQEIVHGIPGNKVLKEGDIVSVDIGLKHKGVFADHAVTVPVGTISSELQTLLSVTQEALAVGVAAVRPGACVGDVGHAIETFVAGRYGIVRGLAGHGVGRYIHEDPYIPNYGKAGTGAVFKPGMVVAIEPMLNLGTFHSKLLKDGYTFVTTDGKPSAHFEHTILVTDTGYEILTQQ